ncbi:DUF4232 domain-containing protein [Streptomyces sp. NPDC050619]|uniref:DUF4232 domain-containing protein n=1 Tax=Streptomyces sp. NPDC050619 TaxID=3157214 RepID=UPI00341C63A8
MSTRTHRTRSTHRTRILIAAAITAATMALTACNNGEGVQDEGASAGSASTSASASSNTPSPKASEGTSTGAGQTDPKGSAGSEGSAGGAAGSNGTTGSKGSSGSSGSSGTSGSNGSSGSAGSDDSTSASTPCTSASTRMAATEVSRPLNHLLLTVTNTGSKNCDLTGFDRTGYPALRFENAQSVPPAIEGSKQQAVVTLAPGESGYAGVLLSAADGSGSGGYTAKSLAVLLDESGSAARPSLPAKGVYIDSALSVTYWQPTMADALAW